ncbi:cytochrome C [candidate division KSB1 bacterium]|nr:MAG: cytochrome C [candidate division KSB1 bacterium]
MKKTTILFFLVFTFVLCSYFASAHSQSCIECHKKNTPGIVSDWELSKHSQSEITCSECHIRVHESTGKKETVLPTPETCARCHEEQVKQFKKGKHALAWAAMKAMPTIHWQPMALTEGMKGCGGCHKIGLKTNEEIKSLKENGSGYGVSSCDACHTRHIFSVKEAKQPQACQTCHMGFDHPQWEMYSSSKMGIRYLLKQKGIISESAAAPTCQMCHLPGGDHNNRTAWGFLAVRLPMPEDKQWTDDRTVILQALGVLDPDGKPTTRLDVVKKAKVARLTEEDWKEERNKMLNVCYQCHAKKFAKSQLEKGDNMIKEADHLMAEAIRIVAGLYKDGVLKKSDNYSYSFPDLLTFHDAPSLIEQKLFVMFLKHRMRTFQGAFHSNPDYALWYGWSEMKRDLTEIKTLAEDLRKVK